MYPVPVRPEPEFHELDPVPVEPELKGKPEFRYNLYMLFVYKNMNKIS